MFIKNLLSVRMQRVNEVLGGPGVVRFMVFIIFLLEFGNIEKLAYELGDIIGELEYQWNWRAQCQLASYSILLRGCSGPRCARCGFH